MCHSSLPHLSRLMNVDLFLYLYLYLYLLLYSICVVAVAAAVPSLVVLSYVWFACFGTIP